MHLTVNASPSRRSAAHAVPARRGRHPRDIATPRRRRRAPAPQDAALYTCQCGRAWTAAVTTSVDCPSCGTLQAW